MAAASTSAADRALWHGYLLADQESLPIPSTACASEELARPKYTSVKSAEYLDSSEVLSKKADLLIKLLTESKQRVIYSGAGISTSAGCYDYASNAKGSVVQAKKRKLTRAFIDGMIPTPSHRICVALERAGFVEHWLQQNHDGLAQKAGFPYAKINEIHGSWHDIKNPVIKMSGTLRDDLFAWMQEWMKKADFVLALGTSFSGMSADGVADCCAGRHLKHGMGNGLCIVGIQKTPMDCKAALRVFAKLDDFMEIVRAKMRLAVEPATKLYPPVPMPHLQKGKNGGLPKPKKTPTSSSSTTCATTLQPTPPSSSSKGTNTATATSMTSRIGGRSSSVAPIRPKGYVVGVTSTSTGRGSSAAPKSSSRLPRLTNTTTKTSCHK